jgi:F-type H+-transporting ATPase subunit beta
MAVETRPKTKKKEEAAVGTVVQIIGPVLDVQFEEGHLPEIYHALTVTRDNGEIVVAEVQQHLGNNWVRAVAMSTTDGLRRGMKAMLDPKSPAEFGHPAAWTAFSLVGEGGEGK